MEKFIYDKNNGLWYELKGDYYFPCLMLPEEQPIGIWGRRHGEYLKDNHKVLYHSLLCAGKLNWHLLQADKRANEMLHTLMQQMATQEGVTEQLKMSNQLEWAGRMNNIRARAEEIVRAEVICCL